MRGGLVVPALLLAAGLAGCIGGSDTEDAAAPATAAAWTPCEHPWPCGDGSEWPTGLEGPFDILEPEQVSVASFDGTLLDGWIWRPDLPEGVGAPVVLEATPYLGKCSYQSIQRQTPSCMGSGGSDARLGGSREFDELLAAGYAVAIFSVRGTAGSGGCYDLWGADEQQDQVATVEWLAAQPWSNGRVAMSGISYMGTTPLEAAIHQAPSLKAVTVAGIVSDPYLGPASPQGAIFTGYDRFQVGTALANGYQPPWSGAENTMLPYAGVAAERACPQVLEMLGHPFQDELTDDRSAAFYDERRLVDHFGDVQAAVLMAHGFLDDSYHRNQEDVTWNALTQAPKWFMLGQWGHTLLLDDAMANWPHGGSWLDVTMGWYDFWLKGLGEPPARLGLVDYQDSDGQWHEDGAWPLLAAREEALFLAEDAMVPTPQEGASAQMDLAPVPDSGGDCADDMVLPGAPPRQLLYAAAPVTSDLLLAGNPYALLDVAADRPSGLFASSLYLADADWSCGDELTYLTDGGVDLRFHDGGFQGSDFPVGTTTTVRLDYYNLAHVVPEGKRIVLGLRAPDDHTGRHDATTLTVEPSSRLVLPLVEGSLGGAPPTGEVPPRPFDPTAAQAPKT